MDVRDVRILGIFAALTCSTGISLVVGNHFATKVDRVVFKRLLLVLLIGGSVFIAVTDCTALQVAVVSVSAVAGLAVAALLGWRCGRTGVQTYACTPASNDDANIRPRGFDDNCDNEEETLKGTEMGNLQTVDISSTSS